MRHGLSLGELARWFVGKLKLDLECHIIELQGWKPEQSPGFGWPVGERAWVNPSPNAANLSMARCYGGTVMFEGTTLSEGREGDAGRPEPVHRAEQAARRLAAQVRRRLQGPPAAWVHRPPGPRRRVLVRADISQIRPKAVRRHANSCR